MSANGGPQGPQPVAVLQITMMQDRSVGVSFPSDEIITRFLLDKGADLIRAELAKRAAAHEPNRIVPGSYMPRLNG